MRRASRRTAGGTVVALVLAVVSGCADTYVESSATTAPADVAAATTAPVDVDAPVADLLREMAAVMLRLDTRISEDDDPAGALARIDALWDAAEPTVRATDLDATPDFDQAIDLATTGVERRRPADASKAYKALAAVVDAYLGSAS